MAQGAPMTLPDPIRRALRTFCQAAVGAVLSYLYSIQANPGVPTVDTLKTVAAGAIAAGVVSLLHNWSEDTGLLPSVGKTPTSPTPPRTVGS